MHVMIRKSVIRSMTGLLIFIFISRLAGQPNPVIVQPDILPIFGNIPELFKEYQVVVKPDSNKAEWWAGAPSVIRDEHGMFWMACRMRSPLAPRGQRGYEIRILSSPDGIHFKKILSLNKDQVPISGFERPALLIDPKTNQFKLYACGPWQKGPWSIFKFADAAAPSQFLAGSAYPVITPMAPSAERDITVLEYKDPVIIIVQNVYHCYVIGYIRNLERIFHFISRDGEQWQPVGHPNDSVLPMSGWHDFFIRPASVLPLGIGYLFVYEGSNVKWHDPVYNDLTGIGFTFDLHNIIDLTPTSPLIKSTTPSAFHTWRYSTWLWVGYEIWIYAEVVCPNDAHEIRVYRIPVNGD
jgi:hypothetical protein